jgi:hypothetical protein
MANDADYFQRIFQIALNSYNAANPTAQITADKALRALVLALESQIAANVANAGTVTAPV